MLIKKLTVATAFCFLLFINQLFSQYSLPRSTPEQQGVSSQAIIDFLDSAVSGKNEFHSFMFVRHGKVIAEGWWNPYRQDIKHTMYSLSKSFTATAVGLAVKQRKLKVSHKVISFFPDELPDTVSQYLREMTVKDLLTMSAGQDPDPTRTIVSDTNWIRSFLALPVPHKPGAQFLYNSMATYMLSAIVQKVTGQKVFDYLTPKLFQPLGIQNADWETDLQGINTGGWGLRITTEDIAKFGQLYLQRGKWKRRRILSKIWIKEATSSKIIQHPDLPKETRDKSDWEQGYCYQMWRCRNNAYRGDGAYGQFCIIMPDQDAVIAITSETTDMQNELNAVWKFLLPAMKKKKQKPNNDLVQQLKVQLRSLALPVPGNSNTSDMVSVINGKNFVMQPNDKNIESVSFQFSDNLYTVNIKSDTAAHSILFAPAKWHEGETTRQGPYLVSSAKNKLQGLPPFKVAGEYNWRDENKLELILRYIESPHTETLVCYFDDNKLKIEIKNSISTQPVTLTGEVK
ncbi:MAG TPA: serine hydrolase [Flavitalea sp.]|nr:serine hydrolase [Flavitalea sp.]